MISKNSKANISLQVLMWTNIDYVVFCTKMYPKKNTEERKEHISPFSDWNLRVVLKNQTLPKKDM
jgi:hypothetical protein